METNSSRNPVATNFMVSVLFLLVGLRFNMQGDAVGTVIYSLATTICLLRAGVYFIKRR